MDNAKPLVPAWMSRTGAGLISGLVGAAVLGLVLTFGWSLIGDILNPSPEEIDELGRVVASPEPHALFGVVAVLGVFVSTLSASIVNAVLRTLGKDLTLKRTVLAHVFLSHMVLLVVLLPAYIMSGASANPLLAIGITAGLHMVLSLLVGHLAYSLNAESQPALLPVFGFSAGLGLLAVVLGFLLSASPVVLILAVVPLAYALREAGDSLVQSVYDWFRATWGVELFDASAYVVTPATDEDDDTYASL